MHEINLETSDVIAILAMLVSGLSALYARWSWGEAKKANQISVLGSQREIYDAFFELKMHMPECKNSFAYGSGDKRVVFTPYGGGGKIARRKPWWKFFGG
eukprot:gene40041-49510_t